MEGLYHIDMNRTASSKMKAYFIYVVDEDVYLNVYSDWEEVIFVFLIFEECHPTQFDQRGSDTKLLRQS